MLFHLNSHTLLQVCLTVQIVSMLWSFSTQSIGILYMSKSPEFLQFQGFFVFRSQDTLTFFAAFNMIYIHLAYEKSTFTKANAPRLPVAHGLKLVVQLKVESDLFRPVGGGHCIVTNK